MSNRINKYTILQDAGFMKIKTSCVCLSHVPTLQPHGLYIARQAPLSMEFSRQGYWSRLPFPTPGDLPNPRMET